MLRYKELSSALRQATHLVDGVAVVEGVPVRVTVCDSLGAWLMVWLGVAACDWLCVREGVVVPEGDVVTLGECVWLGVRELLAEMVRVAVEVTEGVHDRVWLTVCNCDAVCDWLGLPVWVDVSVWLVVWDWLTLEL